MTSAADKSGHALFQKWDMYSIVVRENYMRHAEIVDCIASAAGEVSGPISVVDIGCGDGWLASTALQSFPVERYLGIDLSAAALKNARARHPIGSGTDEPQVDLRCEDLRTAIPAIPTASANVVLASYSLHHVSQPEKRSLLQEIRRILISGGLFLWTDIVRLPGHSRLNSLNLQAQEMRDNWHELSRDDVEQAVAHIHEADYPEEELWMTSAATELGFQGSAPLYRDSLYGCWAFKVPQDS